MGIVLDQSECEEVRSLYANPRLFRSRVDMTRFRFGRGEYQYFGYPLPSLIAVLRETLYRCLFETANDWMAALSLRADFPGDLNGFLEHCRERGQNRPTPLILRYRWGEFNCLHQDL
jgi:uncharacterized protein